MLEKKKKINDGGNLTVVNLTIISGELLKYKN